MSKKYRVQNPKSAKSSLTFGGSRRVNPNHLNYSNLEDRRLLAPLVGDDFYSGIGNTELQVNASGSFGNDPSVKITGSLFDNDDAGVSLESFDAFSVQGASITVSVDGSFTYSAVAGVTDVTDTFTYTVSDSTGSSTAVVSIELTETVWYVDNSVAASGDGTSTNPFDSLASVNSADGTGDVDSIGDVIFVASGASDYGELILEEGQRLTGEGVALVVNRIELSPSGDGPTLVGDEVIQIHSHNLIEGVFVQAQEIGVSNNPEVASGDITIRSSAFMGGVYGVRLGSIGDLILSDTEFSEQTTGFSYSFAHDVHFSGNRFLDISRYGIFRDSGDTGGSVELIGNEFINNGKRGIYLSHSIVNNTERYSIKVIGNSVDWKFNWAEGRSIYLIFCQPWKKSPTRDTSRSKGKRTRIRL